jgi:hypothetical protein
LEESTVPHTYTINNTDPPVNDWPLYWFVALEKAVEQGDHQAAAEAERQLRRLGVRVAYGRPRSPISGADAVRQGESR